MIIRATPNRMPGIRPPMKSWPMDTPPPAAIANRIMLWEGGIITPWQEEVTVTATEKSLSYPESVIMGMRMEPMEDVSATAEPEIPPKNMEARIFT